MEDFPKLNKVKNTPTLSNEQLAIYKMAKERLKSEAPKLGFIKARLNRDNFWNLMVLLGTSIALGIVNILALLTPYVLPLALVALVGVPYLISKANPVVYKEQMFHSAFDNRPLAPLLPRNTGFTLFFSIPFTVFGILFIHDNFPFLDENLAVYSLIFWFIPTLYFILLNYPASFLFNKKAWPQDNPHWNSGYEGYNRHESFTSPSNMLSNPINSWYSGNIHHRK